MDSTIEPLLPACPRIRRAWQWTGLILFCLSQQGCMCGCSHPHTQVVTPIVQKDIQGSPSHPLWDGNAKNCQDWLTVRKESSHESVSVRRRLNDFDCRLRRVISGSGGTSAGSHDSNGQEALPDLWREDRAEPIETAAGRGGHNECRAADIARAMHTRRLGVAACRMGNRRTWRRAARQDSVPGRYVYHEAPAVSRRA
jgi:hypothetical protein